MAQDVALVLLQEGGRINNREWVEAGQGIALLRKEGFDVSAHLIGSERQREQLAKSLRQSPPRVILILVGLHQTAAALALLNAIKLLPPETSVAISGSFGTLCSHEFTTHRLVDAVLLGEWVDAAASFAHTQKNDLGRGDVTGVWWKSPHGWKLTGRRIYSPNLEDWPDPDLEDLRGHDLCKLNGWSLPLHASRGYPFQTLFTPEVLLRHLQLSDTYYHVRPVHRVIQDAERMREKYKCARFEFADLLFPWEEGWTQMFAHMWQRNVKAPFSIRILAEQMTDDRLRLLKAARLERVELCVESGNESLRRRLSDANQSNREIFEVIDRCHKAGIDTRLRLLLGVPGETIESLRESVHFAEACGAHEVTSEIYRPWPESSHWSEVEKSITGETMARLKFKQSREIARDVVLAFQQIERNDSLARAERVQRKPEVTLDGVADYHLATVRSPLESAARVARFHAPTGSHDVVALRVPAEIIYKVRLPKRPILKFGLLLEPAMPGCRSRLPVSFSIKIRQRDKTWRLFQKILIQALDPDSRKWHWFKIPVSSVVPGEAELLLENMIYGHGDEFIPPGNDIWAGWTAIQLTTETSADEAEATDEELLAFREELKNFPIGQTTAEE